MNNRTLGKSSFSWLRKAAADKRGVSAVAFAISFAVLAPMALGVFDVFSATEQRGKLQDALDAAALYAARSDAYTTADVNTIGNKALHANLQLISGATLQSSSFVLQDTKVVGYAQVALPAYAPMEFTHQPVSATSEVQRALDRLEVALVLDNTGSMAANNKLTTLQADAKQLIDTLVTASQRSTDPNPLKISLVPFSQTVRVQGTTALTSYNTSTHTGPNIPAWVDPQAVEHASHGTNSLYDTFATKTDRLSLLKTMGQSWAGCVEARTMPYDIQEDAPTSSVPATMFVPYFWPDELGAGNTTGNSLNDYRADPGSGTTQAKEQAVSKYTGTTMRSGSFTSGYNYGPNAGCGLQQVIRLTANANSIKSAIDGMAAVGDTNIPLGLMWGWHTLSPQAPFADGSAYGTQHLRKVIILMTDGANTFTNRGDWNGSFYSGLGYVWQHFLPNLTQSSSATDRTAAMDARLAQLCTNIKAKNIYIYTVRIEFTQGSPTLLQNCATTPDDFYDVANVANLNVAFNAIAGSISNLRISH